MKTVISYLTFQQYDYLTRKRWKAIALFWPILVTSFLTISEAFSLRSVPFLFKTVPCTPENFKLLATSRKREKAESITTAGKQNNEAVDSSLIYSRKRLNSEQSFTLEYSPNFQRHIVKEKLSGSNTFKVVESFLWLDAAMAKYPDATLLPIHRYSYQQNFTEGLVIPNIVVAGVGFDKTYYYPKAVEEYGLGIWKEKNAQQVREVLENTLKLYPGQINKLFDKWSPLELYPAEWLEERIQFLLAPLPNESILRDVNVTEDIDWPKLFYNPTDGISCGAGMSIAQVSHALQVLPDPFILRLDPFSYTGTKFESDLSNEGFSESNIGGAMTTVDPIAISVLYSQTPSVVLEMAHSVLDLWVSGVSNYEVVALAFLHWQGWEWTQCRVMLHAFPSIAQCSLEPSWELYERGGRGHASRSTVVRNTLIAESMAYLQTRLHLRPWHIHAMLKTHPRLSGYSPSLLRRNVDFLQKRLNIPCSQLRGIILLMPSLLGVSIDGMDRRIRFWTGEMGLSLSQLAKTIKKKPALLQYSVENNLRAKAVFFTEDLQIEKTSLVQMTIRNPELWGRSLERYIRPMAKAFCTRCGDMSLDEYGQMIAKTPELLRYSWIGNLSKKLDFLQCRLRLKDEDLKELVVASPRVLLQAIPSSLKPKIELLEKAGGSDGREAIQRNPSLLLNSKSALQNRIQRVGQLSSGKSLADALTRSTSERKTRGRKTVLLVSEKDNSVEMKFDSVGEAASHAGISQSNMYNVLRNGRSLGNRKYIYGTTTSNVTNNNLLVEDKRKLGEAPPRSFERDIKEKFHFEQAMESSYLTIEAVGRAFPPEDKVRGRRRSGGMALRVHDWSHLEWRETCGSLWKGRKIRLLPDGQTVIIGYHYTRPSRPRCSLFACREALRVAFEWLKRVSTNSAVVTIMTDSNYALELLQNASQVEEWGALKSKDALIYIGPGETHKANPDILYPLSCSFYHLTKQDELPFQQRKNVVVKFEPASFDEDFCRVRDGAALAAQLMYSSM